MAIMSPEELEKVKQKEIEELRKWGVDILLMNPPYDRSTHLDFLETANEVSDNVVSVQPVRWLEEVISKDRTSSNYNKYKEGVSKHIKDLEVISSEDAKSEFNILYPGNLGIYVCDKAGGYDYDAISSNSIIDKIVNYIKDNLCNLEFNKKDGYRVRIPFIGGARILAVVNVDQL